MFLLAGGDTDPQILCLLKQAATHGIPMHCLLKGQSGSPRLTWNILENTLKDGKKEITASAAFIRQDVFAFLASNKQHDHSGAREWYVTVAGWLQSSADTKVFNRDYLSRGPVNKPYILYLAHQLGFQITDSLVSNDSFLLHKLAQTDQWVTKPVNGGAHCEAMDVNMSQPISGTLSYPQIIQRKLEQPELRIFRVGEDWFAFSVISDALDYRTSSTNRIVQAKVPSDLKDKLEALSNQLGLDFAAADFKTDSKSKQLQFLEINTSPMFAGFDQIAEGELSTALLRNLGLLPKSAAK